MTLGKLDLLTKYKRPQSEQNIPICFGNLLTARFVLTPATCFLNMEKIVKAKEKGKQLRDDYLSGKFLKSGIEKYIFVRVILIIFLSTSANSSCLSIFLNISNASRSDMILISLLKMILMYQDQISITMWIGKIDVVLMNQFQV